MRRPDESEIARWLSRCRAGDERAWHALVDRFKSLVYSVARRTGLSADDAEDVFMTTFASFYKHLDRIEEAHAVAKWLAVTATRESYRLSRSATKHGHSSYDDMSLDELLADEDAAADRASLEAAEADHVRQNVLAMDAKCRDLLQALYLAEETDYGQVSATLGMPVGSIGPTRARCLEKLRAALQKDGFFDAPEYQATRTGTPDRGTA